MGKWFFLQMYDIKVCVLKCKMTGTWWVYDRCHIIVPWKFLIIVRFKNGKFLDQSYLAMVVFFWFPCKQAGDEQSFFFSENWIWNHAIYFFFCNSCKVIAITMIPLFSHNVNKWPFNQNSKLTIAEVLFNLKQTIVENILHSVCKYKVVHKHDKLSTPSSLNSWKQFVPICSQMRK